MQTNFRIVQSPFFLNGTVKAHLKQYLSLHLNQEVQFKDIAQNLYVDVIIIREAVPKFKEAEIKLNKWKPTSQEHILGANSQFRKYMLKVSFMVLLRRQRFLESFGRRERTILENHFHLKTPKLLREWMIKKLAFICDPLSIFSLLGVRFEVMGIKLPPCLKLVRIMLETSNLARMYTPICIFRK